jgi:hypothetical protein
VLNDLRDTIGMDDGIVDYSLTPSVAVGYAVTEDNAFTEDGVCTLPYTLENTIAGVYAIVCMYAVAGVDRSTSRTGSVSSDGRVKASA